MVQAGQGGLADGALQHATALVREYKVYGVTREENLKRKLSYLADWLATKWSNTSDPRYYNDAVKNSDLLRKTGTKMSPEDVHLLYIRNVRAITGNTPYQLIFMARGVIDLTGKGWVNGTYFDHSTIFNEMGVADSKYRQSVTCQ